jgi:mRNA-degrading endonuclease YafQ of YafQ-DinJ toxin-antitoxin module
MRTIEWTSSFMRDYKRAKATPQHRDIETLLPELASLLADDKAIEEKRRDGAKICTVDPALLGCYRAEQKQPQILRLRCASLRMTALG